MRSWILLPSALAVTILFISDARAVETQLDGTVIPVQTGSPCPGAGDVCLQSGLNIGEGFAANAANNPLNAIFDAHTTPEVFAIPKDGSGNFGQVTFLDVRNASGFNSSFGWYNVDDPQTPHQVLACNTAAGASVTVDFQA